MSYPTPPILIASLGFMAFIFILARRPDTLVAHRYIRKIGVLSFSADILHSLFVHGLPTWSGGWINVKASGHAAIGHFLLLWVTALCATVAASMLTYVLVEQPGIALARSLTSRVWGPSERKAYARSARPAAAEQLHKP